jgi:hypothetical protein
MKRILGILVLSGLMSIAFGQKSIDALFAKYADNEGFVSLTINGNLLNLLKSDKPGCKENQWPGKVNEIRILVQEDEDMRVENFYDMVMREINRKSYEEFMSVRKSEQDLHMYVRSDGDLIKELLIISGGEDNFIIQLKGRMTIKEAEDFCSEANKDHGTDLLSNLN